MVRLFVDRFQSGVKAWGETVKILSSRKKLLLPFIATAIVELFFILLVWLAPHPPFSTLLAPPIRYFFSDRVLHYPWHMWFLYYSMKHTHMVASLVVGAFLTGVACVMVQQSHRGETLSVRNALVSGRVHYLTVAMIWLVTWAVGRYGMDILLRFFYKRSLSILYPIGIAVILQWLLVYAIPAAVFNGSRWWKAILQAVVESLKHPLSTLAVVAVFTAPLFLFMCYFPEQRTTRWIVHDTPEIALLFVAARLFLWTAVDAFLTVAAAHLWCLHNRARGLADNQVAARAVNPQVKEGPAIA